ncbi:hypothetical protein CPC16_011272 [Podila verticillata]|nr:hypothetical protein CPC16_011272 [Podila verticillata]
MNASSAFHFQPNHFTASASSSSGAVDSQNQHQHQHQHQHRDTFSFPSPPPSSNPVESGSTSTATVTTSSLASDSVDPFAAALGQSSAVPCTPAVNTDQFSGYFPPSSSSVVDSALFASAFAFPVPTPAAVEISSFAASSPSYFPSTSEPDSPVSHSHPQFPQNSLGFNLPPPTPYPGMPPVTHFKPSSTSVGHPWEPYPPSSKTLDRPPSSAPAKSNLSISMPLASLMSPPHSMPAWSQPSAGATSPPQSLPATSALANLGVQSMNSDTVSKLLNKGLVALGESDKNTVLLLDMRSSTSHAASSIKTSVNICLPNMLLKRPMFSLTSVMAQLTTEEETDTFSRWQRCNYIVFFDASGAIPTVGSPAILMAQKFRKEGYSATIAYLSGGYNAFVVEYSSLCNFEDSAMDITPSDANTGPSNPKPRPTSTISPARQRLHLGSLPSMMTQPAGGPMGCQTPMIENPNVNPLFESVRQSIGLNTNITEEIPVRLPVGFSVDIIRDRLPNWLLSALADTTGKARLAEYFQKVEISEKSRLALLMLPQAMRSGRTTIFSIGAGIEKGLKNRYHNIWPYDHTRVKIAEREEGHDDYINASYLKPPLSNKSYIATQGPLPSTFQDFWKVTWEQNSRVIVMLTREQEMGRIKCHQYWPTAQSPVMDLGVVQVTLVSETLPDPSIGTILVRQVKLRHLHSPEERLITQIQYTGWPDFGVPETPLEVLKVIQLSNEHNTPSSAGPMIVHCSAGCGRTGAFCVIDSILTELKDNPELIMSRPRLNLSLPSLPGRSSDVPSRSLPNERVANAMAGSSTTNSPTSKPDDPMSDIVFQAVSTFREHRMSMVQTLRHI